MIILVLAAATPPDSDALRSIGWQDLAAACAVMGFLVSLATGYLHMLITKALHEMRDKILLEMKTNFVFKEAHEPTMHNIKKEIVRNEAAIEKLSARVDEIDLQLNRITKQT